MDTQINVMNNKNTTLSTCLIIFLSAALSFAGGEGWMSDLNEGLEKAKKEGKPVLAEFTGSDWCHPCIMMQKKVFSKKDFVSAASKDYVLVVVDSPKKDKQLASKNEKYFIENRVQSVPTVVIFNPDGSEKERFGASQYPSVDKFLAKIKN